MVPDRGPEIFKLAPRGGLVAALLRVLLAQLFIDVRECLRAEECPKVSDTRSDFLRTGVVVGNIIGIDVEYVRDPYFRRIALFDPRRLVLGGEIFPQLSFSRIKLTWSAACALSVSSIADDPDGLTCTVGFAQLEACAFGLTRHASIMSLIARKVVNCLPAIVEMASLPLAASRRNPLTVMPPCGKASAAASAKRSGVSSVMSAIIAAHPTPPPPV
jgi:hypothetical protein